MITTEEAEAAALERNKPAIEAVKSLIAGTIRDAYIVGKPVVVDVPTSIKSGKRGKSSLDVHLFIVEVALESFTTPSSTGSYWNATIADAEERNGPDHPMTWRIELNAVRAPAAANHL